MYDSAIADYDAVLRLDPGLADIFNARGELWRKKGDRPKAVADFGAALRLNPDHPAAKANHKSLAQELERVGALKAVEGKPSFNCATARRPVEKAICANRDAGQSRSRDSRLLRPGARRRRQTPRDARTVKRAAGRIHRPAQCAVRQARLRPAKGHARAAAAINGVDGY